MLDAMCIPKQVDVFLVGFNPGGVFSRDVAKISG